MTDKDPLAKWATWREIHAQPDIWDVWGHRFSEGRIRSWIAGLGVNEVWFTGAGTSAYIGDILVAALEGQGGPRLRSIPSTDIVARPHAFLSADARPLVVSFGRSGNSAESLGVLDALDALAPNAPRLNITCNAKGALATRPAPGPQEVVLLPDATHDAGFAMTSSFSTMYLTALALFGPPCDLSERLRDLSDALRDTLTVYAGAVGDLPERAVFVGSGPLAFAAREAALKVMELSAGQIPALWDSTLGFRHGPKSFVRGDTAITVFLSSEPHAARYDADLVAELRSQFPKARVTTVGPGGDIAVPAPNGDAWAAPVLVAYAQIAAVKWSQALGLGVDDPFAGQGTLSRVVSGVKLYPVAK
ncbi:SIS domain-containing protein [Flavimaricola marinus]|uniref:Putative tagatose-6-phosphate ketose/aldose isomerase n=1 Tax=Flavimaricola marinus TaxID=1819565 RepID=A0A238LAS9_9RHOB|nr:SIS domain-containing protein [Flavimaricola marinus]SMY06663.1 Putative tagatose-6-phosphate ketose/aldose isomerase [Flavimaricola marinus]